MNGQDLAVIAWTSASGLVFGVSKSRAHGDLAIYNIQQAPDVASEHKSEQNESSVLCFCSPPRLVILHKQSRPNGGETTQNICAHCRSCVHVLTSTRSIWLSNRKEDETFTSFCFYFHCMCVGCLLVVNQENPAIMRERQSFGTCACDGQSEGSIRHHIVYKLSYSIPVIIVWVWDIDNCTLFSFLCVNLSF